MAGDTSTSEGDTVGNMVDRLRGQARGLAAALVLGGALVGGALLAEPAAAQTEEPPPRPTDLTIPFPDDIGPAMSRADRVPTPEPGGQAAAGCTEDVWTDPNDGLPFDVTAFGLFYDCDQGLWIATVGVPVSGQASIGFSVDTDGNVYGNGCGWGDYSLVAEWRPNIGDYITGVFRTPSCDSSTWTFMGDAYLDIDTYNGLTWFDIGFVGAQIGSPTSVAYNGGAKLAGTSTWDFFPNTGYLTAARPAPTYPAPVVAPAGGARLAETHSIFRLYSAYLLRQPDTAGMAFWEYEYLFCAQSLSNVSNSFARSPEFTSRYGNVNDAEFVALIYANVLGRAPEDAGFAYWVESLGEGIVNRGQVMVGFSESNEYVVRTGTVAPQPPLCTPRIVSDSVYRLYRAYFLREPEAEGERYWTFRYSRCETSLASVSDLFAGSAEFQARYGSLSNRAFVELVYLNVLGRPGEASGIDYWTNRLAARAITRGGMMIGFSDSAEFVGRTGTFSPIYRC